MTNFFCFPSPGTTTRFSKEDKFATFKVFVLGEFYLEEKRIEVEIVNNINNEKRWVELKLLKIENPSKNQELYWNSSREKKSFILYSIPINLENIKKNITYEFCFRFRFEPEKNWNYLGQNEIIKNGFIVIPDQKRKISSPLQLFENPAHEEIKYSDFFFNNKISSWKFNFTIPAPLEFTKEEIWEETIGHPKNFLHSLALQRKNTWWLEPYFGGEITKSTVLSNNHHTQFLLAQNSEGVYILIIPITTEK